MGCSECPLKGRQIVKYEKGTAPIMIIGEAPAREELMVGRPFVGDSGRMLNNILSSLGMSREHWYIANAIRCPLDKANDRPATITAALKCCREYLLSAIEQVKPKLIVTLGKEALRQMAGRQMKMLENRGKLFTDFSIGIPVFATVHPSYVLRQGGRVDFPSKDAKTSAELLIYNDFKSIKYYLKHSKLRDVTGDYKEGIPTKKWCGKVVAIDYETSSDALHNPTGKVVSLSFSKQHGESIVYVFKNNTMPSRIRAILEDENITKVVAFRPFEEEVTRKFFGFDIKGTIIDVLTLAHVIDENHHSYSLEEVASIWAGMPAIKEVSQGMRFKMDEAPREVVVKYNGVDTDATITSFNVLSKKLKEDKLLVRYYKHYMIPIQNAFSRVSDTGIKVDIDKLDRLEDKAYAMLQEKEADIIAEIPERLKRKYPEVGVTKTNLMTEFLFTKKGLGLKPKMFTPKDNKPALSEEHLSMFQGHPVIEKIMDYKKLYKIYSTYFGLLRENIKPDLRIYPKVLFTGTVTGRTVILDPPLQQFPVRNPYSTMVTSCLVADDGYVLVGHDLAQSEIRVAGWLAGDVNILQALQQGIDIHTRTASLITGIPVDKITKEQRHASKAVNFGLLYGMHAPSFVEYARNEYGVIITLEEAEEWRSKFFAYPDGYYKLPIYHEKMKNIAKRHGYVRCVLGRKRHLPLINSSDYALRSKAERQAINTPVQNFSSELACIGIYLFEERMRGNKNIKLTNLFIHDAYYYMVKPKYKKKAEEVFRECMCEATKQYIKKHWGIEVGYPIEIDTKEGTNLSFKEEQW